MTSNMIALWNYQETVRHNLANEGETYRHNVAGEGISRDSLNETKRMNSFNMDYQTKNLALQRLRSDRDYEVALKQMENNRYISALTNATNERIANLNASVSRANNAADNATRLQTSRLSAATTTATNAARMKNDQTIAKIRIASETARNVYNKSRDVAIAEARNRVDWDIAEARNRNATTNTKIKSVGDIWSLAAKLIASAV